MNLLPQYFLRSILFNLSFYFITGLSCAALLPTLLLPRRYFMGVVSFFVHTTYFLERHIMGLSLEIRGVEHIPAQGAFLVAAKHQSAYETTKLHIIFKDPAIVLKKELLKIPLWGWYLAKSDVIAIDRSTPKAAIKSIQDGALRMKAQGRPIVIFPQGTRVKTSATAKDYPYKIGIMRIQEATDLPIIPMALNSGVFWPRNSFFKKPGRVIFEFLPSILPNTDSAAALKKLEETIEAKSNALMAEGLANIPKQKFPSLMLGLLVFVLLAYNASWFITAHFVQKGLQNLAVKLEQNPNVTDVQISKASITGFPFQQHVKISFAQIKTNENTIILSDLHAYGWPILGVSFYIETGKITLENPAWRNPIAADNFTAEASFNGVDLNLWRAKILIGDFTGAVDGTAILNARPYPDVDMTLSLENYTRLFPLLSENKMIPEKTAKMANVFLQTMQSNGKVSVALSRQGNALYLGFIKIYEFPKFDEP